VRSAAIQPLTGEWAERLKEHANRDAATAAGGGGWPFISLKGGQLQFNEDVIEVPLKVIILGGRCENTWYREKFDPQKRQNPTCWALALEEKDLAPPADLKTKQHPTCEGCWANAFGTDDRGRGKACGNRRRLALLPGDRLDAEVLSEIEGARLRVPVTSVSGRVSSEATEEGVWSSYSAFVTRLAEGFGRPMFSVVSKLDIIPDDRSQFKLIFAVEDSIDDPALLEVLEKRTKEAQTYLDQPPQADDTETTAKRGKKPTTERAAVDKRKVARRKSSGGARKKTPTKKAARKKTAAKAATRKARRF
jgi:hypothetical protein